MSLVPDILKLLSSHYDLAGFENPLADALADTGGEEEINPDHAAQLWWAQGMLEGLRSGTRDGQQGKDLFLSRIQKTWRQITVDFNQEPLPLYPLNKEGDQITLEMGLGPSLLTRATRDQPAFMGIAFNGEHVGVLHLWFEKRGLYVQVDPKFYLDKTQEFFRKSLDILAGYFCEKAITKGLDLVWIHPRLFTQEIQTNFPEGINAQKSDEIFERVSTTRRATRFVFEKNERVLPFSTPLESFVASQRITGQSQGWWHKRFSLTKKLDAVMRNYEALHGPLNEEALGRMTYWNLESAVPVLKMIISLKGRILPITRNYQGREVSSFVWVTGKILGKGGSGIVVEGFIQEDGRQIPVALKIDFHFLSGIFAEDKQQVLEALSDTGFGHFHYYGYGSIVDSTLPTEPGNFTFLVINRAPDGKVIKQISNVELTGEPFKVVKRNILRDVAQITAHGFGMMDPQFILDEDGEIYWIDVDEWEKTEASYANRTLWEAYYKEALRKFDFPEDHYRFPWRVLHDAGLGLLPWAVGAAWFLNHKTGVDTSDVFSPDTVLFAGAIGIAEPFKNAWDWVDTNIVEPFKIRRQVLNELTQLAAESGDETFQKTCLEVKNNIGNFKGDWQPRAEEGLRQLIVATKDWKDQKICLQLVELYARLIFYPYVKEVQKVRDSSIGEIERFLKPYEEAEKIMFQTLGDDKVYGLAMRLLHSDDSSGRVMPHVFFMAQHFIHHLDDFPFSHEKAEFCNQLIRALSKADATLHYSILRYVRGAIQFGRPVVGKISPESLVPFLESPEQKVRKLADEMLRKVYFGRSLPSKLGILSSMVNILVICKNEVICTEVYELFKEFAIYLNSGEGREVAYHIETAIKADPLNVHLYNAFQMLFRRMNDEDEQFTWARREPHLKFILELLLKDENIVSCMAKALSEVISNLNATELKDVANHLAKFGSQYQGDAAMMVFRGLTSKSNFYPVPHFKDFAAHLDVDTSQMNHDFMEVVFNFFGKYLMNYHDQLNEPEFKEVVIQKIENLLEHPDPEMAALATVGLGHILAHPSATLTGHRLGRVLVSILHLPMSAYPLSKNREGKLMFPSIPFDDLFQTLKDKIIPQLSLTQVWETLSWVKDHINLAPDYQKRTIILLQNLIDKLPDEEQASQVWWVNAAIKESEYSVENLMATLKKLKGDAKFQKLYEVLNAKYPDNSNFEEAVEYFGQIWNSVIFADKGDKKSWFEFVRKETFYVDYHFKLTVMVLPAHERFAFMKSFYYKALTYTKLIPHLPPEDAVKALKGILNERLKTTQITWNPDWDQLNPLVRQLAHKDRESYALETVTRFGDYVCANDGLCVDLLYWIEHFQHDAKVLTKMADSLLDDFKYLTAAIRANPTEVIFSGGEDRLRGDFLDLLLRTINHLPLTLKKEYVLKLVLYNSDPNPEIRNRISDLLQSEDVKEDPDLLIALAKELGVTSITVASEDDATSFEDMAPYLSPAERGGVVSGSMVPALFQSGTNSPTQALAVIARSLPTLTTEDIRTVLSQVSFELLGTDENKIILALKLIGEALPLLESFKERAFYFNRFIQNFWDQPKRVRQTALEEFAKSLKYLADEDVEFLDIFLRPKLLSDRWFNQVAALEGLRLMQLELLRRGKPTNAASTLDIFKLKDQTRIPEVKAAAEKVLRDIVLVHPELSLRGFPPVLELPASPSLDLTVPKDVAATDLLESPEDIVASVDDITPNSGGGGGMGELSITDGFNEGIHAGFSGAAFAAGAMGIFTSMGPAFMRGVF